MREHLQFYIGGRWVEPQTPCPFDVIDPSTEQPVARISLGSAADLDRAVKAAATAFETWQFATREERMDCLARIVEIYERRMGEMAEAITLEMGAPAWLSKAAQAPNGAGHFKAALEALRDYPFEIARGTTLIRREPVGVCGLITPWNWPINQVAAKVAPAIAAGCTMVLKPSELAPLDSLLLAEIIDEAGLPAGVFNLVNGDGAGVGAAMARHPGIDMVSFTGSTRAGVLVAKAAAETVKRVALELGGKSANIILEDADLEPAVKAGTMQMILNSGQSCNAPSRMFVPRARQADAVAVARATAEKVQCGLPDAPGRVMGPLANAAQFRKVRDMIGQGIAEGATLVTGGTERPEGMAHGYYVRPTVFADVRNDMTIAREEIFGPVLCILPYDSEDEAVAMANDTPYGLSGYVSGDPARARAVAARLRTGNVHVNGAAPDFEAPFGGYKQSGNGREWGVFGLEEYLETKAVMGGA
jgi:aldehyde dehydrogenase (NAD+)